LRRARQRGPRPAWCEPPSSWMKAAVALVLIPGPNARGVHFGETNPRGGNATCLTPRVQSKRQSLYFFLLFTGIGCSLIPTQPWRAHLLPPLRPVGNGNRGDTCSEDGRDSAARLIRRRCFSLANSLEVHAFGFDGIGGGHDGADDAGTDQDQQQQVGADVLE
jgi:hypothetical protein